jgi:hypothetical protein
MDDYSALTEQERFIPEPEDLASELVPLAVNGDLAPLSNRLGMKQQELEMMLASDEATGDMLAAIAAEYEELVRMKLLLRSGEAVDTLTTAMREGYDAKKAMAAVKAAEAILDRSRFPKQTRMQTGAPTGPERKTLPDLDELLAKVDNPAEAQEIFRRHRALIDEIEALRRNAKEILDVAPVQPKVQETPES